MEPLTVLLNTQTPLLQFLPEDEGRTAHWEIEPDFAKLEEGTDFEFSPGGVTRMVYPLAKRLIAEGLWKEVHWVALNPKAPETVRLQPGITLHNVNIDPRRMRGYGKTKEAIWTTVHGLSEPTLSRDLFWTDDYGEYTFYNRTTAELIRGLDQQHDFDLFYVHDFQQLPIGHMIGSLKPKIFRWHIPFDPAHVPEPWRPLLETFFNAYDVVVVSSESYRDALKRFGHRGRVERVYPYVDPEEYHRPAPAEVETLAEAHGIDPSDTVVLVVARMDPAKGQDRAIEAIARLAPRYPTLKLVLVGNGSFSSSPGGVGLSKGSLWRRHLEKRAESLGVADRVVLTGHVSQSELDGLYERCAFTVLPSSYEGFGLVVVESWLHHKPAIVSDRAGVAELVRDGENGLLFGPDDPASLAQKMQRLLRDRGPLRERLGESGFRTARVCTLETAVKTESRLLGRVLEA